MTLHLEHVSKKYRSTTVLSDFSLSVSKGELVVIVGPSGSGKTTVLRLIAGLETPDAGAIMVEGEDLASKGPADRGVAMVFQDYALYPHMTVFENIAFPLVIQKVSKKETGVRVRKMCKLLDLVDIENRKPLHLSGGEKQRVALGRALIKEPTILLMDEPFSSLDAMLRTQLRDEIIKIHSETEAAIVFVTHDQTEAMTLADRIVVVNKGSIQQEGTPSDLYFSPKNIFVASFIGSPKINLINGVITDRNLRFGSTPEVCLTLPKSSLKSSRSIAEMDVVVGFRPEDILAEEYSPDGSYDVIAVLDRVEMVGSDAYLRVRVFGTTLLCKTLSSPKGYYPEKIGLNFSLDRAHFFHPVSGARIQ